jgi:predicted nucleic acid binding AN1-type Zn finger protein
MDNLRDVLLVFPWLMILLIRVCEICGPTASKMKTAPENTDNVYVLTSMKQLLPV